MKGAQLRVLQPEYRLPLEADEVDSLLRSELADWLALEWFYPEGFVLERLSETPSHFISSGPTLEYIFPKGHVNGQRLSFSERWQLLRKELSHSSILNPERVLAVRLLRWEDGELVWLDSTLALPLPRSVPEADEIAIVARRVRDGTRLSDVLLDEGELSVEQFDLLTKRIVDFHLRVSRVAERSYSSTYLQTSVFEPIRSFIDEYGSYLDLFSMEAIREIQRFLELQHAQHELLFRQRSHDGFVGETHGALRAHAIVVEPLMGAEEPISVLGNSSLVQDVLADLASIAVDVSLYGANYIADEMLRRYESLVPELFHPELLRFYQVVQALTIAIEAFDAAGADRTDRANRALGYALRLALGFPQQAILVVCGSAVDEAQGLAEAFAELLAVEYLSAEELHDGIAPSMLNEDSLFDRFLSRLEVLSEDQPVVVAHWLGSPRVVSETQYQRLRDWLRMQGLPYRLIRCNQWENAGSHRIHGVISALGDSVPLPLKSPRVSPDLLAFSSRDEYSS